MVEHGHHRGTPSIRRITRCEVELLELLEVVHAEVVHKCGHALVANVAIKVSLLYR